MTNGLRNSAIALSLLGGVALMPTHQPAPGRTLIGPGRSPGAARVPDPRDQTRGRRTSSRSHERLMNAPFNWTR